LLKCWYVFAEERDANAIVLYIVVAVAVTVVVSIESIIDTSTVILVMNIDFTIDIELTNRPMMMKHALELLRDNQMQDKTIQKRGL
jgi:hypothetical protein